MAHTAETAERYEDMCQLMKGLVEFVGNSKEDLLVEERNLLSVAYKNVIGTRRASWRTLNAEDPSELIRMYKTQIEAELEVICQEILGLLQSTLIPTAKEKATDNTNPDLAAALEEARVFYLKMAADYYRYLAEFVTDKEHAEKSAELYTEALTIATKYLKPTHPIRLGLALNCSVCYYEILQDKAKACDLAKNAFDQAISKLDSLDEASYKDSTLIMQLLRDNLTLWTSAEDDDDAEN